MVVGQHLVVDAKRNSRDKNLGEAVSQGVEGSGLVYGVAAELSEG